jgi:hypothetical protein
MPEQPRNRDCIVLIKGDTYPVAVSADMSLGGWPGGQGVQWVGSSRDEFLVTYSDGYYAGFLLYGSDEEADQHTSITRSQPYYRYSTACAGGWHILTSTYERYTYASRKSGGALVPLTYQASDQLVFSLRGYLTKETTEWVDSGIPSLVSRGLNEYYIAFVSQAPSITTNGYLGVQTSI